MPLWIRRVIEFRESHPTDRQAAIAAGLAECARNGTTTVGEIAVAPWTAADSAAAPIDSVVFLELMGLSSAVARQQLEAARRYLAAAVASPWTPDPSPLSRLPNKGPSPPVGEGRVRGNELRFGLSPHAPYTASLELVAGTVQLASQSGAPLAMHLAESPDEIEFLQTGGGPFRRLLEERGKWLPEAVRSGTRPLDYLQRLVPAPRALVVHGNYLDDEEIAFVAAHASRMSVVYCPRTHAYFGHPRHPLARLLQAGANVCLGTDSRASNPDLSLLTELRFVAQGSPELSPARVLELGTVRAAEALGRGDEIGTISPGKLANLCAVALLERDERDPHALLLDSDLPVTATWVRGTRIA